MSEALPQRRFTGGQRAQLIALVLSIVGLVAWCIGLVVDARRALFSLLTAYAWLATIVLGAHAFLMTIFATRAQWPTVLRRLLEAIVAVTPLLLVLFIPLALGRAHLYPWAAEVPPAHVADAVRHQGAWWSSVFFLARAAIYFAVWLGLAETLRRWSLNTRDVERNSRRCLRLSGIGLVLLAFTLTFASFDWLMSLTPDWYSSIYGLYLFAGGFLAAFAVLVLLLRRADDPALLGDLIRPAHFLSLGKLLLTHVIFWAYLAYSQYFIIWIAALPHESSWWIPRTTSWAAWTVMLVVVHFALPFAVLLSRALKLNARRLAMVSVWLIVAHYLDVYWLVMPVLTPEGVRPHWLDIAALLFVVGSSVALGLWRARGHSLVPLHDPALAISARYEGS